MRLKPMLKRIVVSALLLVQPSFANEEVSLNLSTKVSSRFVERGFRSSERFVGQISGGMSYKDFSGIGFGNYDFKDKKLNIVSSIGDYTRNVGKLTTSLGYVHTVFPDNLGKTREAYMNLALNKPFNLRLTLVHNFDEKGQYVELGVNKNLNLERILFKAKASLGLNHHYFIDKTALSHLKGDLSIPLQIGEHATFVPSIGYSRSLSEDFQDNFYGSLSFDLAK
jgi:hypothetical protein